MQGRRPVVIAVVCGVAALAVVAVLVWRDHRPNRWVGTSEQVTLLVGGCGRGDVKAFTEHGRLWVPDPEPRVAWPVVTTHAGTLHFDSATSATFRGPDGTVRFTTERSHGDCLIGIN